MFHPITGWQTYVSICLVSVVFYYTAIVLYYYRKSFLKNKGQSAHIHQPLQKEAIASKLPFTESERAVFPASTFNSVPDLSTAIHNLTTELSALMEQSAAAKAGKTALQLSVHQLIKKYSILNGSGFESAVLNLVAVLSESHCNIHFTAEELAEFRK